MSLNNQENIDKTLISITTQMIAESGEPFIRQVTIQSSLSRHLGIDSLGRAELFRRIEKHFHVDLPDALLAQAESLQDIAIYLQNAHQDLPLTRKSLEKPIHIEQQISTVNPFQAYTLIDILLLYAEQSPNKAHIYFQNENGKEEIITYAQLLNFSLRMAQGLKLLGLKPGETVAIMQPTSPWFFYSFFGTLLAGGIPVPIYPPFRLHMLEAYAKTEARILKNAEVRFLITFSAAERLSQLLKAFVPSLKMVVTAEDLLAPDPISHLYKANEDHFAFIQYTSGSTSDPKGVLLTHANLLANIRAYGKAIAVTPEDVAVSWLPLYHDMGLIGMWLGSLHYGVPLVLLTPFSFLNHPEKWFWAIHYHRGTLSGAPNFAYELCIKKADPAVLEGLDLSSWRMTANGAEKIYPRTLTQFVERFAPYGFRKNALLPVYGLAESTVALLIPKLNEPFRIDHVDRKLFEEERIAEPSTAKDTLSYVSCGRPIENHEVRIVDEEGNPLPERRVGQLQFRGPSNMQGYYHNPTATQAVMHDGWIDSGDLAYCAEGDFFITGRRKDLIIKAGRNLYPAEIEEIVSTVASVRQGCVAAFGVTDAKRGTEQLVVVAETRETRKKKQQEMIQAINEVVANALDMVPDHVILVKPHRVPKTSSGKLQRAACKNLYLSGALHKKQLAPWMQISRLGSSWFYKKILGLTANVAKFIYTFYVALLVLVSLPIIYLGVMITKEMTARKIVRTYLRWLIACCFCPMTVRGLEHLEQAWISPTSPETTQQPVIYAANHASYIDSIVLIAVLPLQTRLVGKAEILKMPVLKTFMKKLGYLAVNRLDFSKGIEDTKHIEAVLRRADSVLIFPEGTFGYTSGLRPFRLGAFKVSAETSTAVCPVALKGTRTILRDDEKLLRPGKVVITICEPVRPQGQEWKDVTSLRTSVREEIAKYCGEPSLDYIAAQTVATKPPAYNDDRR